MWIIESMSDIWGDDNFPIYCLPKSKYSEKQIKHAVKMANKDTNDDMDSRLDYESAPIGKLSNIMSYIK